MPRKMRSGKKTTPKKSKKGAAGIMSINREASKLRRSRRIQQKRNNQEMEQLLSGFGTMKIKSPSKVSRKKKGRGRAGKRTKRKKPVKKAINRMRMSNNVPNIVQRPQLSLNELMRRLDLQKK